MATNRKPKKPDKRDEAILREEYEGFDREFTLAETRIFRWLLYLEGSNQPWEDTLENITERLNIKRAETFQRAIRVLEALGIARVERERGTDGRGWFVHHIYHLIPYEEWNIDEIEKFVRDPKKWRDEVEKEHKRKQEARKKSKKTEK